MAADVVLRFVQAWDGNEIADLYRSAGWWKEEYDTGDLPALIRGSFCFLVAVDAVSGDAVGMGRVIADGVSDGYIQDLVVLPEYRGTGIGRQIVSALVWRCREAGLIWIGIIAEPGTEEFYRPLGFHPLPGYVPLLYREGP